MDSIEQLNHAVETSWPTPTPEILFGMMLLAALVGGFAARFIHVPKVVGYLVVGVALKIVTDQMHSGDGHQNDPWSIAAEPLGAIKDLALGLILFTIGGAFEKSVLKAAGSRIVKIATTESLTTATFVATGAGLFFWIGQSADTPFSQAVTMSLLLATAAIATAPAATLFVLQEYEAKGSITNTILGVTAINNVICIVAFHATFHILSWLGMIERTGEGASIGLAMAATTLGSVALGILLGLGMSIAHGRLSLPESILLFFGLLLLLGAGEHKLQEHGGITYNFLLTSVVIGAIFANTAIDPQRFDGAIRQVGSPIMAGFFVMAGYGLHLNDLATMGLTGVAYVVFRIAGKTLGARMGVTWSGELLHTRNRLGSALLCQAAVVLGLARFVELNCPATFAGKFSTIILGSVVVFELIGPLLVKRCVVYGGEVKAITLMGAARNRSEGVSVVGMTIQSFLRLIPGFNRSRNDDATDPRVEHVMRTNVQLIPASATLDDVLHLIERSTYSHFPVVDQQGHFCGVIRFSDVSEIIYDPTLRDLVTAIDLADPSAAIVPMQMTLEELLEVFTQSGVGVLAVVESTESRKVVGVAELRDLLKALHIAQKPAGTVSGGDH